MDALKLFAEVNPKAHLTRRRGTNKRSEPAEGTKLRAIWDLFQANRGKPVDISFPSHAHTVTKASTRRRQLEDLKDYYGLDIRCLGSGKWVLAGQWIDSKYVDYTKA